VRWTRSEREEMSSIWSLWEESWNWFKFWCTDEVQEDELFPSIIAGAVVADRGNKGGLNAQIPAPRSSQGATVQMGSGELSGFD
jgi:hypothetical protein